MQNNDCFSQAGIYSINTNDIFAHFFSVDTLFVPFLSWISVFHKVNAGVGHFFMQILILIK